MAVNPTTAKKLSNMRTTSSDENIILKPPRKMTLEQAWNTSRKTSWWK